VHHVSHGRCSARRNRRAIRPARSWERAVFLSAETIVLGLPGPAVCRDEPNSVQEGCPRPSRPTWTLGETPAGDPHHQACRSRFPRQPNQRRSLTRDDQKIESQDRPGVIASPEPGRQRREQRPHQQAQRTETSGRHESGQAWKVSGCLRSSRTLASSIAHHLGEPGCSVSVAARMVAPTRRGRRWKKHVRPRPRSTLMG